MKSLRCLSVLFAVTALVSAPMSFANEDDFSPEEQQTMLKEDLASTAVLTNLCPQLVEDQTQLNTNLESLRQINLSKLKGLTAETLAADAEYQSLLKEAQDATANVSQDEQKSICEDVLTYHLQ